MAIDVDFLNELDRFRMVIKQKVLSKFQGGQESILPGEGLIFKDFSAYAFGDDVRRIDWNVYGRTEKLFLRRFEEDKSRIMHVVLDASASMNFGNKVKKFDYAAMIGLGFAYMTLRDNGRYKFATFSDKLEILNIQGRNIMKIIDHLNKLKVGGKTNLIESMESYKKNIQSKSMLIVVSDFLYELDQIKEILLNYKKSNIYFIQVLDPLERNLDLKGDFILKDMETNATLRTFISNRFRNQYRSRLQDHILGIKDLCDHHGAKFISVGTDQAIFDVFYNILFNPN